MERAKNNQPCCYTHITYKVAWVLYGYQVAYSFYSHWKLQETTNTFWDWSYLSVKNKHNDITEKIVAVIF